MVTVAGLQGTRFAILHGEPTVIKPQLSVYDMRDVRNAVKGVSPVLTNAGRNANMICWSPAGKNLVLAGLKVPCSTYSSDLLPYITAACWTSLPTSWL